MIKTVTIFGPTNITGRQLITHAMVKGWHVKVFGRNTAEFIDKDLHTENFTAIKGYVFDAVDVLKAVTGSDAVLSSLSGFADGINRSRSLGMKNIIAQMQKAGVNRIVAVGSIGILPDTIGNMMMEHKDFPAKYIPMGLEDKQAYSSMKESSLDWTYVCPPEIISGDADNKFTTVAEKPLEGDYISTGNLALFMVNELERNEYLQKRVGIANSK